MSDEGSGGPKRKAKIGDNHSHSLRARNQMDVAGLEIPVDDAGRVSGSKSGRHLQSDGQSLFHAQPRVSLQKLG